MIKEYYSSPDERQQIMEEQLAKGMMFFSDHSDVDLRKCLVFATAEEMEVYNAKAARIALNNSDSKMGRVVEDLINLLVAKGIMASEELPAEAIERIADRVALRDKLSS